MREPKEIEKELEAIHEEVKKMASPYKKRNSKEKT